MNYIAGNTRPNISFAVSSLARYLVKPGLTHWNKVKKVCNISDALKISSSLWKSRTPPIFSTSTAMPPGARILTPEPRKAGSSATFLDLQSHGTAANSAASPIHLPRRSSILLLNRFTKGPGSSRSSMKSGTFLSNLLFTTSTILNSTNNWLLTTTPSRKDTALITS